MANTKDTEKKAPRKPRTSKPKEENLNKEVLLDTKQDLDPSADPKELAEANPEITELQKISEEPKIEVPGSEPDPDLKEKEGETPISDPLPEEDTKLPEDVTPFDEFTPQAAVEVAEAPGLAAYIRKLNPNLEDGKSKWLACVATGSVEHKLFKGSYLKAYNAANNYNIKHGFGEKAVNSVRK